MARVFDKPARIFLGLFILFLGEIMMDSSFAQLRTLYVVTRSTKSFRIQSQKNPVVGLFATRDRGMSWRHLGWTYTKCFSVAISEVNRQKTFYLACGNGVQISTDNGRMWKLATGWNITECLKVAVDRQNPDIIYTATAYGIFKSTDGGQTWQEKNKGLTSTFTPTILIDPKNPQRLFCATEAGVHRSDNAGDLWEPTGLWGLGVRTIVQNVRHPNILVAGTENDGIFISTDYGKTWQQKNHGLTHKTVYALALSPQNPQLIFAGTFQGGVFKTLDSGQQWWPMNHNLGNLDIHALLIDPLDTNTIYAGTLNDGVWLTTDGGKNWEFIGLETSQVWDMIMWDH
ncbi:MAG: hypothetical protein D6814_02255 [Calditrichaeota bacterium]|nr:MAG: hypothetical protein D6814_02255 [Calditrichota bacterium]